MRHLQVSPPVTPTSSSAPVQPAGGSTSLEAIVVYVIIGVICLGILLLAFCCVMNAWDNRKKAKMVAANLVAAQARQAREEAADREAHARAVEEALRPIEPLYSSHPGLLSPGPQTMRDGMRVIGLPSALPSGGASAGDVAPPETPDPRLLRSLPSAVALKIRAQNEDAAGANRNARSGGAAAAYSSTLPILSPTADPMASFMVMRHQRERQQMLMSDAADVETSAAAAAAAATPAAAAAVPRMSSAAPTVGVAPAINATSAAPPAVSAAPAPPPPRALSPEKPSTTVSPALMASLGGYNHRPVLARARHNVARASGRAGDADTGDDKDDGGDVATTAAYDEEDACAVVLSANGKDSPAVGSASTTVSGTAAGRAAAYRAASPASAATAASLAPASTAGPAHGSATQLVSTTAAAAAGIAATAAASPDAPSADGDDDDDPSALGKSLYNIKAVAARRSASKGLHTLSSTTSAASASTASSGSAAVIGGLQVPPATTSTSAAGVSSAGISGGGAAAMPGANADLSRVAASASAAAAAKARLADA